MKQKFSDFKIISVLLTAIIIFFTLSYFRHLPLTIFNLNINNFSNNFQIYYFILTELLALTISIIFIILYLKKSDIELKKRYKSIGIGLGAILVYFLFPYLQSIPFIIFSAPTIDMPLELKVLYLIAFNSLTAAIIMFIYKKKIIKDFNKFKKNSTKYFTKYIKYWFLCLGIMMVSNLIINTLITNNLPANEQAIRDTFDISPLYIFFSAVIYAPIVEELVFRQSIKNIFSNKIVFIIISGLLFGGMHVFGDFKTLSDLLYIIPYSAPGIMFAYMLADSDNIFVPISFHLIHNGILISLQFIVTLLG